MVHPPTVEPGLLSLRTDGHLEVGLNDNSLEVVQFDAKVLIANQVVKEAFIRLLLLPAASIVTGLWILLGRNILVRIS
jgi:hypothetical protein